MRRSATLAHFSLIVGLFALTACSSDPSVAVDTTGAGGSTLPPATGEPAGTQTFTDLEQTHVDTPVNYPQTPPVGGPHSPAWQTCAFYDTAVPNERGVHSMEHGAVWITYSPDLDAAQVAVLKTLQTAGKEVLVSQFEGLPTPLVASAWGKQLQLESAADPRLAQFVSYFDDGPQTPEVGTPCEGGTTETG